MLDASIYIQSINLDIQNMKAARCHGDEKKFNQFLTHCCQTLEYCSGRGLLLDVTPEGTLSLKRDGCTPSALRIIIDGQDGFSYRTAMLRLPPSHRYGPEDGQYPGVRYSDDPTYGQFAL